MAELTLNLVTSTGTDLDAADVAAAAGGDSYSNDDQTFLYVFNGGGGTLTLTIPRQRAAVRKEGFGELAITDIVVTVNTMIRKVIKAPPFSHSDANGKAQITYNAVTSVTVAALRLRRD